MNNFSAPAQQVGELQSQINLLAAEGGQTIGAAMASVVQAQSALLNILSGMDQVTGNQPGARVRLQLILKGMGENVTSLGELAESISASPDGNNRQPGQESTPLYASGAEPLISFTEEYSVQVSEIDGQHSRIMDYINQVHTLVKENRGLAEISKVMEGLAGYTISHFATEEEYFERFNYPDAESHKATHSKLLDRVTGIIGQLKQGDDVDLIEVVHFLKAWLLVHIKQVDKRYSGFMNDNGVY
ncbi:MAG: bacteriohemerythrin [Thermodesulfobacteriota bacterium]